MGVRWMRSNTSQIPVLSKRLLHREQGVPLKGPFLGHFSQGNLGEMNENAHFSVFRIFCGFDPALLGCSSLAPLDRLGLEFDTQSNPEMK